MLEIGSLLDGKYRILEKVGQGGMSVVYRATDETENQQWAVKAVRKNGIQNNEINTQGIVAEANILRSLSHPSLPRVIDVIDTADSIILIMDYVQGRSLHEIVVQYGAQSQEQVMIWAKQLCNVLRYLHTRTPAIIYRDMKPANIMLMPDGNVTLIDFGTAFEFHESNFADTASWGTAGYAAPEQFRGTGETDSRSDIYCLGATLYHLVTGVIPGKAWDEIKPIREINRSLSIELEQIIQKCMQGDPNDRFQSAAELMDALEQYEKIDHLYKKKQKGKILKFILCSTLTVAFAAISAFGYFVNKYLFIGGAILAAILLIVSVLVFICLKVPKAMGDLKRSGTRKNGKNIANQTGAARMEKGALADQMISPAGMNGEGSSCANGTIEAARIETQKLPPNHTEADDRIAAVITEKLAPDLMETAPLVGQEEPVEEAPVFSGPIDENEFVIEYEITYIHTNEVIA